MAVSYTNEGYDEQVNSLLRQWLTLSYPDIIWPAKSESSFVEREIVIQNFIQAARMNLTGIDADVQIALGILFYNNGDYEKSIDCFNSALRVRPDDYTLWNRLGATLANSGKSEEAIGKYRQALRIRPNFVRALHNLGVSCMNIQCYQEAAECILKALSLQVKDTLNVSNGLWDSLKRTFAHMERKDLVELAEKRDVNAFRSEFQF